MVRGMYDIKIGGIFAGNNFHKIWFLRFTQRPGTQFYQVGQPAIKPANRKKERTFKTRLKVTTKRDSSIVMEANKAVLFSPVLYETEVVQKRPANNNVTVSSRKMLPDIRNNTTFSESSYTSPACPSDRNQHKGEDEYGGLWGLKITGENRNTRTKPVPVPYFPSKNPHGQDRSRTTPVTNRLDHVTVKVSPAT